jgi:isoamylase
VKIGQTESSPVLPGDWFPLGATLLTGGTNFAVNAEGADRVELCLFDSRGDETKFVLPEYDGGVWHGFVPGVRQGQAYGFRVTGPYRPDAGLRFNPHKLLLDPYARALQGTVQYSAALDGFRDDETGQPSDLDSAPYVPRSLVVDSTHQWVHPRPRHPYADTVIYEVHVKGFTMLHPGVPEQLRGTFAGLSHDAALSHLVDLGVTTIELLPIHASVPEQFLIDRGLTNYWGYNSIGYFAPHEGYSSAARAGRAIGQVTEFQAMVDAVHGAGLEVVLDVVFNHTAEGSQYGPTLCFRGLDNRAYYRLTADGAGYVDTTGCGNSLNAGNPVTLTLIMDSLRYWITEMGVDGFRFDLAPTLARQESGFDQASAFFDLVSQDPVVSRAKLIAEPWDVGQTDSYELGRFPPLWREWNGKFRDTMRDFWRGMGGTAPDFATRFAGSSDLYGGHGRRPTSSVNLITVHDGFSLTDLVSYDTKHNENNGEDNRDGSDDNRSWNSGVEGPTTNPRIVELRARRSRSLLATLLLSFGIPLLLGGDECGRSQRGNNNAYCQDNEVTWFDWSNMDVGLLDFTRALLTFRSTHPVFRRQRFLQGVDASELQWFSTQGSPMSQTDWSNESTRCLAIFLDGGDDPDTGADGRPFIDDDFLILVNSWKEPVQFVLPAVGQSASWVTEIDTALLAEPPGHPGGLVVDAGGRVLITDFSLMVFRANHQTSVSSATMIAPPIT